MFEFSLSCLPLTRRKSINTKPRGTDSEAKLTSSPDKSASFFVETLEMFVRNGELALRY